MSLGVWGESLAARHLTERGWQILTRNFRAGRKEIDLVALRDGVVAFVEVKTRRNRSFGDAAEAVTGAKQLAIASAAAVWMRQNEGVAEDYRFDVITITAAPGESPRIRHLEDAWRIEVGSTQDLPEGVIFGFSI